MKIKFLTPVSVFSQLMVVSYSAFCAPHFRETNFRAQFLYTTAGNQTIGDYESVIYQNNRFQPIYHEYPLSNFVKSIHGIRLNLQLPLNKLFSIGPQFTYETNTGTGEYYVAQIDFGLPLTIKINYYSIGGVVNLQIPMKTNVRLKFQIGIFDKKEQLYRETERTPHSSYLTGIDYLLVSFGSGFKIALPNEFSIFPHGIANFQHSKPFSKKNIIIGIDADKKIFRLFTVGALVNYAILTRQICGGISIGFNE